MYGKTGARRAYMLLISRCWCCHRDVWSSYVVEKQQAFLTSVRMFCFQSASCTLVHSSFAQVRYAGRMPVPYSVQSGSGIVFCKGFGKYWIIFTSGILVCLPVGILVFFSSPSCLEIEEACQYIRTNDLLYQYQRQICEHGPHERNVLALSCLILSLPETPLRAPRLLSRTN